MLEATVNFDNWNRNAAKFVAVLGVQAEKVVKFETGQLLRTLINVTPPKNPVASRKRIISRIKKKFGLAYEAGDNLAGTRGSFFGNWLEGGAQSMVSGASQTSFGNGPSFSGGIEWFAATPKLLYGIAPGANRYNDSIEELERLERLMTPRGRLTYGFANRKTRQKVRIIRNIMTDPKKVLELGKKLAGNIGRMKAGWLVAFDRLGVDRKVPDYVAKHRTGARGGFVNGLQVPGNPTFTIINRATAVAKTNGKGREAFWLQKAVALRAKAMATNFSMIMSGRKQLSDYAKI